MNTIREQTTRLARPRRARNNLKKPLPLDLAIRAYAARLLWAGARAIRVGLSRIETGPCTRLSTHPTATASSRNQQRSKTAKEGASAPPSRSVRAG
jgi:hypothetical protein